MDCRAESRADERPIGVWIDDEWFAVSEVMDQWLDAGVTREEARRRIVKLLFADGRVIFVEQDERSGAWALRPECWRPTALPEPKGP